MSRRKREWLWLWAAIAFFVGAMGSEGWHRLTLDTTPPVRFDRVEVLNSPVAPGEAVRVRIWREKVRDDCPVLSEREAVDQDGRVYDLPDAVWSGGDVGVPYLDYQYPTVIGMGPGEYELRVHLSYGCPNFTYAVDQPVARFRIMEGANDDQPR